jgi:hypothetical protein
MCIINVLLKNLNLPLQGGGEGREHWKKRKRKEREENKGTHHF